MDLFAIVFTELESANLFLCLSKLFLKCEKTCTTLVLKTQHRAHMLERQMRSSACRTDEVELLQISVLERKVLPGFHV